MSSIERPQHTRGARRPKDRAETLGRVCQSGVKAGETKPLSPGCSIRITVPIRTIFSFWKVTDWGCVLSGRNIGSAGLTESGERWNGGSRRASLVERKMLDQERSSGDSVRDVNSMAIGRSSKAPLAVGSRPEQAPDTIALANACADSFDQDARFGSHCLLL